jgi:hypothetical protein
VPSCWALLFPLASCGKNANEEFLIFVRELNVFARATRKSIPRDADGLLRNGLVCRQFAGVRVDRLMKFEARAYSLVSLRIYLVRIVHLCEGGTPVRSILRLSSVTECMGVKDKFVFTSRLIRWYFVLPSRYNDIVGEIQACGIVLIGSTDCRYCRCDG